MKTNKTGFTLMILALLASPNVFAQAKSLAELRAELISSWLVKVANQDEAFVFKITGINEKNTSGAFPLDATYGRVDSGGAPVEAEISQTAQGVKLAFTAKSGNKIDATQTSGGFTGTLLNLKGKTKTVKLEKISESDLQARASSANTARAENLLVKPASDVPVACAAFSGEWTGTWNQENIGQSWLWIIEIDSQCIAKIALMRSSRTPLPQDVRIETIKNETLSFICNKGTGGTCIFKRSGDTLSVSYSNPAGGTNSATFKKTQ